MQAITPTRKKNTDYRSREHLTYVEVTRLIEAAGGRGRHPLRDRTLLLLIFRHGLRASEAAALKWDAVMLEEKSIVLSRLKGSIGGIHRLQPDEVDALEQLKQRYPHSYHLFVNERGDWLRQSPKDRLSVDATDKIIKRAGEVAQLPLPVHVHMLRHSCGYHLAEQGLPTRDIQEYLGHKNIGNTVRYTAGNPARFDRIQWEIP